MNRSIATAAIFTFAIAGASYFAATTTADEAAAAKAAVGSQAPDFQLKDQDGKIVSLSEFKDKVVVLEWFNDGCPFVVKQYSAGDMNKTAEKYRAQNVVWLAVNSTSGTDNGHNKQIAGKWSIERPVLNDADGKVGQAYGAKTTPHMFIVNKGTIAYNGAIDSTASPEQSDIAKSENYVAKALDEVLAGKSVSTPQTKPYGCSVKYAK
jgi:peroxiredoxin